MTSKEFLDKLYPKYKCPTCSDWFHMPFKYCKCDIEGRMEKSKSYTELREKLYKWLILK